MAVDNTGLHYTKIEDFVSWVSENFAGILSNDNVNSYTSNGEAQKELMKEALLHSEAKVDGFLRKRGYSVPIDASKKRTINVLRIYVYNIAVFELYGRRGITKERYYKYTRTMDELEKISEGEYQLPEDIGMNSGGKLAHGNKFDSIFSRSHLRKDISI